MKTSTLIIGNTIRGRSLVGRCFHSGIQHTGDRVIDRAEAYRLKHSRHKLEKLIKNNKSPSVS